MARLKFGSGMVTEARGKLDGIVYSANRGGAYTRTLGVVSNPQSPAQLAVRATMTELSRLWGTNLTDTQREAWNEFSKEVGVTNSLGEAVKLSGANAFVQLNARRIILTAAAQAPAAPLTLPADLLADPPADQEVKPVISITGNAFFSTSAPLQLQPPTLTPSMTGAWDNKTLVVAFLSKQVKSAGTTSTKRTVPYLGALADEDVVGGGIPIPPAWGTLVEGQLRLVGFSRLNIDNGAISVQVKGLAEGEPA